jgi:WD40 repeat protein
MLKRLFTLLSFILAIGSASTQDSAWTAWMYDAFHGHLVRVNSDGDVLQDFTLRQASEEYVRNVSVSPSGTLLTYVSGARQLVIYNTTSQTEQQVIELPSLFTDSISVHPRGSPFNEAETMIALGYMLDNQRWQIDVYDTTSGALQYRLPGDEPAMPFYLGEYESALVPVIQRFEGSRVVFTITVLTVNGDWRYDSFEWDFTAREIRRNLAYTSLDSDTFTPTGEVVNPVQDNTLHNQAGSFASAVQQNSLQAFSDFYIYPFYNATDESLSSPRFVQKGERIAVNGSTASGVASIVLLERDGTLVDQLETIYMSNVYGLSDGFVYTMNTPSATQNTSLLYYVKTRDGGLDNNRLIWSGESGPTYDLIWARDTQQAPLAEFTPWAALTGPFYVGQE